MKKLVFLIFCLMMAASAFAQAQKEVVQKGVSYRYNGKNPRTPLANVVVECSGATNAVISGDDGSFELTFNDLKIGDGVGRVTVRKREMMVFNQQAVDEWSIRKEPLCLILCDANEFENQKQNLIAIGKREAELKYQRQKDELEQQLQASKIDRMQYETKLDEAYDELARLREHIGEYADLFARIDESEIDSLAQRAMDLFNQGKVDEAVQLFEQGNYLEKLKASNRAIQQADQIIETAEQGKAKAEKAKEEQIKSLKAQIAAYKMQNEWQKAGALLKGLADELNTCEAVFEYNDFCYQQREFDEGIAYLQKLTPDNDFQLAKKLNDIGNLYTNTNRYAEAEEAYLQSLEIRRRLVEENPKANEYILARTLNNLARLYQFTQRYEESETFDLEALEIRRMLYADDPQSNIRDLAQGLHNLGYLYALNQRYAESEVLFVEAMELYRTFANENPQVGVPDLAMMLDTYASLYIVTQRFPEAESLFLESLELYRRLVNDNPQAYKFSYAKTMGHLSDMYMRTQRYDESEALLLESSEIYRSLAKEKTLYEYNVASTLYNLGALNLNRQNYQEALPYFEESTEIFGKLVEEGRAQQQMYDYSSYWLNYLKEQLEDTEK